MAVKSDKELAKIAAAKSLGEQKLDILEKAHQDEIVDVIIEFAPGFEAQLTLADAMVMYEERNNLHAKIYQENSEHQGKDIDNELWDRFCKIVWDNTEAELLKTLKGEKLEEFKI